MPPDPDQQLARRGVLRIIFGAMVATVGLLLYPVAKFLKPRRSQGTAGLEVVAPFKVKDLRLDAEGKWPAPFNFGGKPCLVVKTPDGEVRAFNAVCTHVDCTVAHRPDRGDIFCACHNGVYDLSGRNVGGPPPRPLEVYRVDLRGPGKEEIVVSRG